MKKCSKCGIEKSLEFFTKDKSNRTGLRSECKDCRREYNKRYYQNNIENFQKHNSQYYQENRDTLLIAHRQNYQDNCEYYKDQKKQYRLDNIEKIKESDKKYYENNKEKKKEYNRRYRQENKDKLNAQKRDYHQRNPQFVTNRRARRKEFMRDNVITKLEWLKIMESTNWTCTYCGVSLRSSKIRTIDHVIPLSKGGSHTVDNLVPACRSCNSKKSAKIMTKEA